MPTPPPKKYMILMFYSFIGGINGQGLQDVSGG